MAVSAQERSFLLKNCVFLIFGHFDLKFQKVTKVQSCTKFNLQTFLTYVKKKIASQKFELWHDANKCTFFCFWLAMGQMIKLPGKAKIQKNKNIQFKPGTISRSVCFPFFKFLPPLAVWSFVQWLFKK